MRIGIDARMCGSKQGGLGRYIEELIKHLLEIDTENEYVIFLRKENKNEFKIKNLKLKIVEADIAWYGWAEQIKLKNIIKKEKVNLMHFPHWNVPLFYNEPFVVTIHDLLLLHYPTREASALGPISYFFKNVGFRAVLKHATNKARHIIAPSEFTKIDIHKTLKIPLEKISAIHLAPFDSDAFNLKHAIHNKNEIKLPAIPYVLYVGVAYPHKNLMKLLDAWKIFCQYCPNKYQLVLVGKENFFYRKLVNNKIIRQHNNVKYLGFLNDEELNEIYSKATLYVFPSLYEGFGMPPLEAMTHDIPVISSNATCLPEIMENSALYFNPNDAKEMATAIKRGLSDQNLRAQLKNNARALLKKYSWEETAKKTLDVYRHC
jgi:glycosyltransferase involved in cell wall biosynthesis